MKIESMTASFGKLNGTLQLHDGLNILTAPNESGKSTWCAFLLAMFYGIDTAQRRSARQGLPEKVRYQPWSGAAMEGVVHLEWNGRNITLERTSSPRVPFGILKVYDTQSGQPIPELCINGCGEILLGVERSVWERSGFLRQSDLAVTQDAALEQRLHALVSTGDTKNTFYTVSQQLHNLQNACSGRSGTIGKLRARLEEIRLTLQRWQEYNHEWEVCSREVQELSRQLTDSEAQLARHQAYEAYCRYQQYLQARREVADRQAVLSVQMAQCADLPPAYELDEWQRQLVEQSAPQQIEVVPAFRGMTPERALEQAKQDTERCAYLASFAPKNRALLFGSVLAAAVGAGCLLISHPVAWAVSGAGLGAAAILLRLWYVQRAKAQLAGEEYHEILQRYAAEDADELVDAAQDYAQAIARQRQVVFPTNSLFAACESPEQALSAISEARFSLEQLHNAQQALDDAQRRLAQLQDVPPAKPMRAPAEPLAAVQARVEHDRQRLQACERRRAVLQGRMEALCDAAALTAKQEQLMQQLAEQEQRSHIIALVQEHLTRANDSLQARFAPQIAAKAGAFFNRLTQGQYQRVLLRSDFSAETAAAGSPILRPAAALSCGTLDQLSLAVHLALAELLLPKDAPLILDDVLVNFDDARAAAALELLSEMAASRQILLFTCHSREQSLLDSAG